MKAFKAIDNTANEIPVPGNTNHRWKKKKVRSPGFWRGLNQKGVIIYGK